VLVSRQFAQHPLHTAGFRPDDGFDRLVHASSVAQIRSCPDKRTNLPAERQRSRSITVVG
jgi:hypothetical protein